MATANTAQLCQMLNIKYPIIQAGMVYVSGGKLAAAAANAGVLGVIGAGSMSLEVLDQQLAKANKLVQMAASKHPGYGSLAVKFTATLWQN